MKRIAHISNGTITNVSMARDDYTPDGITQMLEADALAAGLTYATRQEEPPPVIVSMTALRLTLIEMELEDDVLAIINAMPDAKQKAAALAWWQTAQTVRRNHPLVAQLAAALGKTDAEIDAIFSAAMTLSATL
jgi:hypothetical protein